MVDDVARKHGVSVELVQNLYEELKTLRPDIGLYQEPRDSLSRPFDLIDFVLRLEKDKDKALKLLQVITEILEYEPECRGVDIEDAIEYLYKHLDRDVDKFNYIVETAKRYHKFFNPLHNQRYIEGTNYFKLYNPDYKFYKKFEDVEYERYLKFTDMLYIVWRFYGENDYDKEKTKKDLALASKIYMRLPLRYKSDHEVGLIVKFISSGYKTEQLLWEKEVEFYEGVINDLDKELREILDKLGLLKDDQDKIRIAEAAMNLMLFSYLEELKTQKRITLEDYELIKNTFTSTNPSLML